MKIAVAADHGGYPLKARIIRELTGSGNEVFDLGTNSTDPVDYPDYARAVAEAILQGRVERAILLCGSGAGACVAANKFAGIWVGQTPGRNGEPVDVAFKFTLDGTTVGGKMYGDYQSTAISEGKISGDEISFVVVGPEQAGNQINESKLRFKGSIKGGEMELTRERESSRNAGNGGGVQIKSNAPQIVHLKRLL